MYLIINLKSKTVRPVANGQITFINSFVKKNYEVINAEYLLDHLDINNLLHSYFKWDWETYDCEKEYIEELKTRNQAKKTIKIDYSKSFHSPIKGKSKIILLGKQGIIKIVKRETSPTTDITSRFGVCIDDGMAAEFFHDCKQSYMYKDYGKYTIGFKDECLYVKWKNIIKEQYENQYKIIFNS